MIYSIAGYVVAKLIAVNSARWSTRLCRPEAISLYFLIALDKQIIRGGGIFLQHKSFALLIAVDTPPRSSRMFRPEVLSLQGSDRC